MCKYHRDSHVLGPSRMHSRILSCTLAYLPEPVGSFFSSHIVPFLFLRGFFDTNILFAGERYAEACPRSSLSSWYATGVFLLGFLRAFLLCLICLYDRSAIMSRHEGDFLIRCLHAIKRWMAFSCMRLGTSRCRVVLIHGLL